MLFSIQNKFEKRELQEALVLPFWQEGKRVKMVSSLRSFADLLKPILDLDDFHAKEGELLLAYSSDKNIEQRIILLGLGKEEDLSVESLRKAYGALTGFCHKKKLSKINILFPEVTKLSDISKEEYLRGLCEGILSANYKWSLKSEKKTDLLESVVIIGLLAKDGELIEEWEQISASVNVARDLINGNADIVTPEYLAEVAVEIGKRFSEIKTTVLNKSALEKEQMELILAVARGSSYEPKLIVMNYLGDPKSSDCTVLIGKGVTFDTGGINMKPTGSVETMRDDMSGAATVIATLAAIAALKLNINVVGVVPTVENAVDANSFKPGDVYQCSSGKTVEIGNTDAEGRLILADAIAYSIRALSPTRIIDFATLTGAMVVALGEGMTGMMSNNDDLAQALEDAGDETGELVWRFPLHSPYKELLKSDIADIKNVGGRAGGAILAGLFLQEFVEDVPWVHLDIAGTAFNSKDHPYLPKHGVGVGVRLAIEYLKNLSS